MFKKIKRFIPGKLWNTARRLKRKIEFEYIKSDGSISKERLIKDFKSIGLEKGDLIFSGTPKGVGKVEIGDKLEGFINDEKLLDIIII